MGSFIIILRTVNPSHDPLNGPRCILLDATANVLPAGVASGWHSGKKHCRPCIILTSSSHELRFAMKRKQFPVPSAMTINKAQGRIFDRVYPFLPRPVFSRGRLYAAISRAMGTDHLCIATEDGPTSLG